MYTILVKLKDLGMASLTSLRDPAARSVGRGNIMRSMAVRAYRRILVSCFTGLLVSIISGHIEFILVTLCARLVLLQGVISVSRSDQGRVRVFVDCRMTLDTGNTFRSVD